MKKITFFIFLIYNLSFSQVSYSDANILIDKTSNSSKVCALVSADLNNNGFKEIIVASYYDNKIIFYKNINGDIQYYQREILEYDSDGSYFTNFNIFCKDIDQDGLIDLLITHDFKDEVYWYKNLGNYNFSSKIIIDNTIDKPTAIVAGDIDNDGDIDLIVGAKNDKNVYLFVNDGNNTFATKRVLYTTSYGVSKIKIADLDNNGFLDIISGNEAGGISWVKNIDGTNFSDKMYLAGGSGDGFEFDFLDINNDTYLDVFFFSNYDDNISYRLNNLGNSFSNDNTTIGNTVEDLYNMKIVDFDKDGYKDIIATTINSSKIGWFQQKDNETFSDFIEISDNVSKVKYFLTEDLNNDGNFEIINSSDEKNLSVFTLNSTTNNYKEKIIDINMSPAYVVKIRDLDNDGKKDIISGFNSVVWNKNYGNNVFSSPLLISKDIGNLVTDLGFYDFNQDGFLDIIAGRQDKLELYKNNNGTNFSLEKIIPLEYFVERIELNDINMDGIIDILISHNYGPNPISKIINDGNFNFQDTEPIYSNSGNGYKAYSFKSADIDNDGDNDIVVGEKNVNNLIWLKNDGSGNFVKKSITTSVACSDIDIGDVNNDGSIDIVTSGDNDYGDSDLLFFKNTSNNESSSQTFEQIKIDTQSLQSIILGDLNNDNYLDIIGTVYAPSKNNESISCYLYNGNQYENKIDIESTQNQGSLDKNASLGDLNNDGKLDIASSYYLNAEVKYFLNNSTLSITNFNNNSNFSIYPNPSNIFISWDTLLNISKIEIYNAIGKKVYTNNNSNNLSKLKIDFLSKGLYFIKAKDKKNNKFFTKLIIE